jgi:hypothetical protein
MISLRSIRKALSTLGWPVADMSNQQITRELERRWFQVNHDDDARPGIGSVPAKGVFVTMATEGNLDALCWSVEDRIPAGELIPQDEGPFFCTHARPDAYSLPERRRAPRTPARDVIRWTLDGENDESTGWLVDRSDFGIAFIAEACRAPAARSEIRTRIHSRSEGLIELGTGTVVRTEVLNDSLTLVCVELAEEN